MKYPFSILVIGIISLLIFGILDETDNSLEKQRAELQHQCIYAIIQDSREAACKELERFDSIYSETLIKQHEEKSWR